MPVFRRLYSRIIDIIAGAAETPKPIVAQLIAIMIPFIQIHKPIHFKLFKVAPLCLTFCLPKVLENDKKSKPVFPMTGVSENGIFKLVPTYTSHCQAIWISIQDFYTPNQTYQLGLSAHEI